MAKTQPAAATLIDQLMVELEAALAVLEPQIQGMQNINNDPLSQELHTILTEEITAFQRREGLIKTVVSDLSALVADGYPTLGPVELPGNLFEELSTDVAEVEAGASVFVVAPSAANLEVNLGPFTNKD